MRRGPATFALLVAVSVLVILGILAALIAQVGRPFPGFFVTIDSRIFPVEPTAEAAGLAYGDRIVSVDGQSPLTLMSRVSTRPPATASW